MSAPPAPTSTSVTNSGKITVTVVVHMPDETGPKPPPDVAPDTPCSMPLGDDNVTVFGPDGTVLASASIPIGSLLFPGNTGFSSTYQCTSMFKISVPPQSDYTFTMQDGWSTSKLSLNYLEQGIVPIDDPNGTAT